MTPTTNNLWLFHRRLILLLFTISSLVVPNNSYSPYLQDYGDYEVPQDDAEYLSPSIPYRIKGPARRYYFHHDEPNQHDDQQQQQHESLNQYNSPDVSHHKDKLVHPLGHHEIFDHRRREDGAAVVIPTTTPTRMLHHLARGDRWRELARKLDNECGHRRAAPYISGGRDAKKEEFPAFAGVFVTDGLFTSNQCGGTILSKTHILTAAHCVFQKAREAFVSLSSKNPYPMLEWNKMLKVKRWCISNRFDRDRLIYDLAILKLDKPLQFNNSVQSACLPKEPAHDDWQGYVVGHGLMGMNYMRPVELQVLPVKKSHCFPGKQQQGVICFASNKKEYVGDSCAGDSGGPVFVEHKGKLNVVGVTSSGVDICHKGIRNPSINMDTYHLRNEILALIDKCN